MSEIVLFSADGREFEFILEPEFVGLEVVSYESDTLGARKKWVVGLKRVADE